jgi:uncharacterized protein
MNIIDAHVHTNFWRTTTKYAKRAKEAGIDFTAEGLRREMDRNGVVHVVTPTAYVPDLADPLIDADRLEEIANDHTSILIGINPLKVVPGTLKEAETLLQEKKVAGFKIYLGYYHHGIGDQIYLPYFDLAAKFDVPVLVHTGDTLFRTAKLKYAHPLTMDDIAVDFPKTRFVLAHLGNPWMTDAAAVCYKNDNLFLDASGLVLGSQFPQSLAAGVKQLYEYVDNPRKLLFGTDWPLAPMAPYIEFFSKAIPEKDHELFFHQNAVDVYDVRTQ